MLEETDFYIPKEKYFGQTIQELKSEQIQTNPQNLGKAIIISGFPYDQGTRRNGGRVGGAVASTIFRKTLHERDFYAHKTVQVYDSGDIHSQLQLQQAHIKLFQKHKELLAKNPEGVLFSIGGSNDQSYPNARALMETYPHERIAVINLDAHFDVRPLKDGKAHSGSPFRQMLLHEFFHKNKSIFIEFACKGATCSNQHYNFLKDNGAQVYWLEKNIRTFEITSKSQYLTQAGQLFEKIISQVSQKVNLIFVSFDNDSINSKFMPGVSAPSVVGGLTSAEAIQIMKITGKEKKVRLMDFSQFNPAVESWISSHLLTEMFYTFAMAFSERQQKI